MTAFYNEIEPYAARWLRNLAEPGFIAPGFVEERSVEVLTPGDVQRYTQCHFFAGLGGWSYALRLAGWPDDVPVWTGSCPCQPFSTAGRGKGFDDERHLWPAWFKLIVECRPAVVFGEQVASPAGLAWLDAVFADLESAGYACAAADLCAGGVGAPHRRQRLYFVAIAGDERRERLGVHLRERRSQQAESETAWSCASRDLADAVRERQQGTGAAWPDRAPARDDRIVGDAATCGAWAAEWIFCRDGKWRAVEPGSFPLAHGVPARVGRLRAYGNAIVPQVAAAFIGSVMEIL